MTTRPSRAKMCNWLSHQLRSIGPIRPFNVMGIQEMARRADIADRKIAALTLIAADLGWHADASLDEAWLAIQEFDRIEAGR